MYLPPLKQFPNNISKAEQERLSREILQAIDQNVRPAYQKLGTFIQKDYLPHGRQLRVYGACQTVTSFIVFM